MGLILKDKGGDFEPLTAGTYVARCVSVIDLGIQQTAFGGKEKVYLSFEVPAERVKKKKEDGSEEDIGPALIGATYTASISAKSILGQHLTSWRGKPFTDEERAGFDLFNILGAPCMINVVHHEVNGKTYANIQGIMRLPAGTDAPAAEMEQVAYTPNDVEKAANFDKMPEWLQVKCTAGHGTNSGMNANTPPPMDAPLNDGMKDDFDDEIPFR